MKTDKYTAQKWVIKVINSCDNMKQLTAARKLIKNYRLLYDLCLIDMLCLEIRTAFVAKEVELFSTREIKYPCNN